ncbi:MAG: hypothetical protein KNN13_06955 [Hydrogenobacter thermophilus]|uniref:hypothetical protein n=1 Tax=Hydrogenobacter thermophilus TaxID=940 RepID=UPI001C76C000|nr:hypothetical protein [Hydrogenobacter thermophilus]QWK20765.1 MAG: hypothetical protein KNN13_06955 [Hydrogenobacter thermophilus]
MSMLNLVREILDKVYHWHRVPASVKAKAVVLYFRGMSLRDVQRYLLDEDYRVSTEAIIWSWLASFITLYTLLEVKS